MLNSVSETAMITLKARAISSSINEGLIDDQVGERIYQALSNMLSDEDRRKIVNKSLPPTLRNYIVLRALKYDDQVKKYLDKHPDALVVSLGCGLDSRYFRTGVSPSQYIELDLPEMIKLKKELLGSDAEYDMIAKSVLDFSWINEVHERQNSHVLFLAEGLFMYLPEKEVIELFRRMASSFSDSCIMFEIVNKKYTTGLYKKMVERKMSKKLDSDAGSSFIYGVSGSQEVESYHPSIEVVEEWSYLEDARVKPKFLSVFKNIKTFTRSQWTMTARIGERDE